MTGRGGRFGSRALSMSAIRVLRGASASSGSPLPIAGDKTIQNLCGSRVLHLQHARLWTVQVRVLLTRDKAQMRKIVLATTAAFTAISLAACSQSDTEEAGLETEALAEEAIEETETMAEEPAAAAEAAVNDAAAEAEAAADAVAIEQTANDQAAAAAAAAADVEAALNEE